MSKEGPPKQEKSPEDIESIEDYLNQVVPELRQLYRDLERETNSEKRKQLEANKDAIEEMVGATLEELEMGGWEEISDESS